MGGVEGRHCACVLPLTCYGLVLHHAYMTKTEYAAVRIPRQTHIRLLAMQKTLEDQTLASIGARVDVSLGSVIEAALDALEATHHNTESR